MEKDKNVKRLQVLDGIRGIAIILVFLNHVELTSLTQNWSPLFTQILFSNGVTGVTLLFILSGFLMAYIYPNPPSYTQFLQKRYTRIFPLFLTMCTVMVLYRIAPDMAWYLKTSLIFGLALISHIIWVYGIKKISSIVLNKTLLFSFLAFQIFSALFYMFWIMRQPPIVLNQQLPEYVRNAILWMVNATLTLPFGNYIPQIDGVYWSLTSEVLFYIVYPVICVPLIGFMIQRKRFMKVITLLALIPFFVGLQILSQKVYGLGILQFQLFYYFICGMVLAHLYRNNIYIFKSLGKFFSGKLQFIAVLLFFIAIFSKTLFFNSDNVNLDPWIHVLWTIPFGFVIALALSNISMLSKLLSSKILVFLGTISFSIYLSHIPVGLIAKELYKPTDPLSNFLSILLHFGLTIVTSMILYYLLEKPYFNRSTSTNNVSLKKVPQKLSTRSVSIPLIATCVILVVAILSSYQSNFNFFSKEYPIAKSTIYSPVELRNSTKISMKQSEKVTIYFTSQDANLQILTVNMHEQMTTGKPTKQTFIFKIKEQGAKDWYAVNTYDLDGRLKNNKYPLGFPPIPDAKDKNYTVELSITDPRANKDVIINSSDTILTNVVKVDKKALLSNPGQFGEFIANKIQNIFDNKEARYVTLLLSPFFLLCLYLLTLKRSK